MLCTEARRGARTGLNKREASSMRHQQGCFSARGLLLLLHKSPAASSALSQSVRWRRRRYHTTATLLVHRPRLFTTHSPAQHPSKLCCGVNISAGRNADVCVCACFYISACKSSPPKESTRIAGQSIHTQEPTSATNVAAIPHMPCTACAANLDWQQHALSCLPSACSPTRQGTDKTYRICSVGKASCHTCSQ